MLRPGRGTTAAGGLPNYGNGSHATAAGHAPSSGGYYGGSAYGNDAQYTSASSAAGGGGGAYGGYASTPSGYDSSAYGATGYGASGGTVGGGGGGGAYGAYGSSGGHAGSGTTSTSYGGYSGGSEFKDKRRGRPKGGNSFNLLMDKLKTPAVWIAMAALFFFFMMMSYRSQVNRLLKIVEAKSVKNAMTMIKDMQLENDRLEREARANREALRTAREARGRLDREMRDLRKERDELRMKYENPDRKDELERAQEREEAWKKQVTVLQQATSRESKRAVLEKFGAGPHQVEVSVVLPSNIQIVRHFVVETAPLDLVPHAVHLFLEQVSHGLWNNAWFYINGPHVIQGGPQIDEDEPNAEGLDDRSLALKPFRDLNLDSLAFPEYSKDFPHVTWTLGYTGRPGGPDFYINKADNTKTHGPGGQLHHSLEEQADACFAKVVSGFDTLHDVFKEETMDINDEVRFFLKEPVHIIGMRILSEAEKVTKVEAPHETTPEEPHYDPHAEQERRRRKLKIPKFDHQVEP